MKNLIFPLFTLTLLSPVMAAMDVNLNEDKEFNLAVIDSIESFDQQQAQIKTDEIVTQILQEKSRYYYQFPDNIGVLFKTVAYEYSEATSSFNKLKEDLLKIYKFTKNVHAADQFIKTKAEQLIQISTIFDTYLAPEIKEIHNENLEQLHERLLNLLKPYQDRLNHFTYENTSKNYTEITSLITKQFMKSKEEIQSYADNIGTPLWGRFIALAAARLNDPHTSDELKNIIVSILTEKVIEGLITQEGRIQGFVNRGFVGLMGILTLDITGQ